MLGITSFVKILGSISPKPFLSSGDGLFSATGILSRFASKKAGGSSKNKPRKIKPKHRRIHYQEGRYVQKGTLIVTQRTLRYHPGLNVGLGRNASLVALEAGRVMVSCEKFDPKEDHIWVVQSYQNRPMDRIYKKYFNVIPEEQHCRFKRVD